MAHNVGEAQNMDVRPIKWDGHCFYVRQCNKPDSVGGIAIPEYWQEGSQWVEVLAIGDGVGRYCSREHAKMFNRARCVDMQVHVGDLVLCPPTSAGGHPMPNPGIKDSTISPIEFIIEETVPLAVLPQS